MMKDQVDSGAVTRERLSMPKSDSKLMGEKRSSAELGEKHELARKRIKIRDLDSVFRSDEINAHTSKSLKNKEGSNQLQFNGEETSQVTEVPVTLDLDASQVERIGKDTLSVVVNLPFRPLDLNAEVCIANNSTNDIKKCAENSDKLTSKGIGVDLNVEDVPSSINQDPCPDENHDHLKSRDVSECGSSTGSLEEKDPLRVWMEMKQNGFLSSSHGGITIQNSVLSSSHGGIPVPKHRMRKSKNDMLKKKMELAKREQVDRFTKIAAPSGLLNELNPGIINHVRNRKQVHSIIEALVMSEKLENSHFATKQASRLKTGGKDVGTRKDQEIMNDSMTHRFSFSHEDGHSNGLSGGKQTRGHSMSMDKSFTLISEDKSGDGDSSMVDPVSEDDTLTLKLLSLDKASENASSLSNEESTNFTSASSLSVKAASVASQWLDLLHQDIKGRLSALRRSKKRVRAVITTELPFLISKEFSSNQENDPHIMKNSTDGFFNNTTAGMHQVRWSILFDQMDNALSEEEKQLESWLDQVKEMQLHCDQGLQHVQWNTCYDLQHIGTSENDSRSVKLDSSEKELAVKAAAASIYSTCNFLLSKENVSCF